MAASATIICDRCGTSSTVIAKSVTLDDLLKRPRSTVKEQKEQFLKAGWVSRGAGDDLCPECAQEVGATNA